MILFEWDETKNKVNRQKHGVWFEEAQSVFDDPLSRVFFDPDHSTSHEDRFLIIGRNSTQKLLVVAHCYRESNSIVRIISARPASKSEAIFYEN